MELLKRCKHSHPLIYMRGIKSNLLVTILDFLYHGEANVLQDDLDSFLAFTTVRFQCPVFPSVVYTEDDSLEATSCQWVASYATLPPSCALVATCVWSVLSWTSGWW